MRPTSVYSSPELDPHLSCRLNPTFRSLSLRHRRTITPGSRGSYTSPSRCQIGTTRAMSNAMPATSSAAPLRRISGTVNSSVL